MSEPKREPHFLVYLLGGPLLFLISLWLIDATGRFFYVLAVAGAAGFVFGIFKALAAAVRSPLQAGVSLAIVAAVLWALYQNRESVARILMGETPFAGRYTDAKRGFSIEYPQGWLRKSRDGFLVYGIERGGPCVRSLGVIRFALKPDEHDVAVFAEHRRTAELTGSRVHEDAPPAEVTIAGHAAREWASSRGNDAWLTTWVVAGDKGWELQGNTCPAQAQEDRKSLRAISQTFQMIETR